MEKVSYALGMSLGRSLITSGVKSINVEKLKKGINDVMKGAPLDLTMEEAQIAINDYFQKQHEQAAAVNIEEGKAFLAENAKRPEVTTTESGLQYEVITMGTGEKPAATDKVSVHYHGTLLDGTVFDSSVRRGQPATFGVTQVISGWVEALQLMPVGSKWKLFIPSQLAYGPHGAGELIGPHATLIFEVELLSIEK
jgi:FKBP-type peptidyl-prolyl cis-trans isomerase FklB